MDLILLALAPVLVILLYVYIRDQYEKEPWGLLVKSLLAGAFICIPVIVVESLFGEIGSSFQGLLASAYKAFIVAGFTEELFKFLALYLLIWKNPNFNERFDGIVYAVFISLGFAGVENVLYVFANGTGVAISRAFTAVPAHALFGVIMGFYFGKALIGGKTRNMFLALIMPIIFHGFYDFILMSNHPILLLLFTPYLIYLWINGFKKMNYLSEHSKFKK